MTDDVYSIALEKLTDKQLQMFNMIHTYGFSFRGAAIHLGISRSAAIDRYDAAVLHMSRAGVRFTPDGRPYLEAT